MSQIVPLKFSTLIFSQLIFRIVSYETRDDEAGKRNDGDGGAIIGPGSILQNSTVSAFAIIFGVTSWSEEFPTDIV